MYEFTDKAIKLLNAFYHREFNRLKLLPIDELNIIPAVTECYRKCKKRAIRRYLDIAIESYIMAVKSIFPKMKSVTAPDSINAKWVMEILERPDSITLYKFIPEVERKKARLIEALSVAHNRIKEIDRALRYWVLQSTTYADTITWNATVSAFKDNGVKYVQWITMEDERVCGECGPRHMRIFKIDELPDRPHYGCRCVIVPVMR